MTEKRWEDIVKEAALRTRATEVHKRKAFVKYVSLLKKLVTVELLIGVVAAFSLYMEFGWKELERTLLSWIIGITLVATIITFMISRYNKITHLP